jgi:DNA modification methylase
VTEPRKEVLSDTVTLWLGDMLQVMPTLGHFDACVADPPYGIDFGKQGSFSASHGWGPWRENVSWDVERPPPEAFSLMRSHSDVQIIWGGNYFTDLLPPSMQWLLWDKGQREFSLADFEMAWSSQNKAARAFSYPRAKARLDGKEHPTQKPLEVMSWCLDQLPKDAVTILDPFMGVASTGVAAVNRGLSFTGIEREPKYFDIARRRISEALSSPRLPFDEPISPKQEMLL